MSRRYKKRRLMAEMNVVPYIDVMLVLLVIFMITAPMMQTGVQIDLPDAEVNALQSNNKLGPLYIAIEQSGKITLENGSQVFTQLEERELSKHITEQLGANNKRPIYIRADSEVPYKDIMTIMAAAQNAGAQKIGLLAEPPNK